METIAAAALVGLALVAWTAWETRMAGRLRQDRRPLVRRNAAVAGAHRLTAVAQLGLVSIATVAAALTGVPLWTNLSGVAPAMVGWAVTVLLVGAAAATVLRAARRAPRPTERRALLAVAATAAASEVVLRGFVLGAFDVLGVPVTVGVLVTALATGGLQAWRAPVGARAASGVLATMLGFLLGLVVLLSGVVLAAVAVHVAVAVLGLARSTPSAEAAGGCACGGHDHDHGSSAAPATTATVASASATATEKAATEKAATGKAATEKAATGKAATEEAATGNTATGKATTVSSAANSSAQPHPGHASCASSCEHAGSSACAVCPLSAVRV